VKLDTHVHTVHSGKSTLKPLDRLLLNRDLLVDLVARPVPRGIELPEVA
jgi:hypothetical protein